MWRPGAQARLKPGAKTSFTPEDGVTDGKMSPSPNTSPIWKPSEGEPETPQKAQLV